MVLHRGAQENHVNKDKKTFFVSNLEIDQQI